jgi:hypothetical protein
MESKGTGPGKVTKNTRSSSEGSQSRGTDKFGDLDGSERNIRPGRNSNSKQSADDRPVSAVVVVTEFGLQLGNLLLRRCVLGKAWFYGWGRDGSAIDVTKVIQEVVDHDRLGQVERTGLVIVVNLDT